MRALADWNLSQPLDMTAQHNHCTFQDRKTVKSWRKLKIYISGKLLQCCCHLYGGARKRADQRGCLVLVPFGHGTRSQCFTISNWAGKEFLQLCFLQVYCKHKCADWLVNWKKMSSNLELFTRFPCRLGLVPPRKGIKMILGMMYRYIVTSTARIRRACQRCFIRIVSFAWNMFIIFIRYG